MCPHSGPVHRLVGVRVLLVDDDPDLREVVATCLETEGAIVSVAAGGNAAFAALGQEHLDAMVCDLWMPDESGYDLIKRVRKLPREEGGWIPAIAVSAAENASLALLAGFHAFLAKPFDDVTLIELIARLADASIGSTLDAPCDGPRIG